MAGWVKAVLFLLGGLGAAAGTAYVTGALDPLLAPKPAVMEPAPERPAPQDESQDGPAAGDDAAPRTETEPAAETGEPETTAKQDRLAPPVFDVLRVEPDGSVLVAGSAAANALVEVLLDEAVLGSATAAAGGDFVVVLDEPLAPGDYRLALRATGPDDTVALSESAAIVSIPEREDGQVLAMIEEPGQPAQLVAVPEAPAAPAQEDEPGEEQAAEAQAVAEEAAPDEAAPQEAASEEPAGEDAAPEAAQAGQEQADEPEQEAAGQEASPDAAEARAEDEADAPAQPQPAAVQTVAVEAVEIEGDTIFVAGRADAGSTVRVYAGTVFLGDAVASEGGRFLVEAKRHLEVGNYLIRADLLGPDGSVVARAAVPFEREPGEAIAAVAPPVPAQEQPQEADEQEIAAAGEEQEASPPATEAAPEAESAAAPAEPEETAEAETEVTAAPLQRVDGAVIIRRGDSLWRISRRVYGHGVRYSTIYLANQDQIHDPNRIWPGQVFTVPGETPEGEQADLDAIGDQAVRPEDRDPVTGDRDPVTK